VTTIRVIAKLPNSEQSYKGKVKTHNYINRQNQSTTGKLRGYIWIKFNLFVFFAVDFFFDRADVAGNLFPTGKTLG
jgi:hypothetical protein